jgi:N-acetylglutamate synthase-like GNAT family acetyltransferase
MIYDVVIHPEHQGEGLGRTLVERILQHPRLASIPCISLFTRDKTDFYERLGFKTDTDHGLTGMLYVRPIPSTYC